MNRLASAILAIALTGACAAQPGTVRVYFGTQAPGEQQGIYLATLNTETGALSPPSRVAEIPAAGFVALHPMRQLLYATTRLAGEVQQNGGVAAFRIEAGGELRLLNTQPSEGRGPCHVSVDATGRCLLVANYGSGSVAALAIDATGALTRARSVHQHEGSSVVEARQQGPHAHSIYPGPGNAQAYAADLGIDRVMIYALDAAKAELSAAGSAAVQPGSGPRHLKFAVDGRHGYVLNELSSTVTVFGRDPESGQLERTQRISTLPDGVDGTQMACSEIRVHPNGRIVYAANRDLTEQSRDSLSVFEVLEGGRLARIQTIAAEVWIPRNFELDHSGRWLLVAGQRSNEISIFRVDPDSGKLAFSGSKVPLPTPMCVAFVPLTAEERDRRGDQHLKAGRFAQAIADFDHFLAVQPASEPHHWRRGIAYYYAGEYRKGVRQFELHRRVNPNDVENAAWHFLCKARLDGVEAARAALLPVGEDPRVPMRSVYAMFAGRTTPAEVLRAAEAAPPRSGSALFYAHLYIGLYHDAHGRAELARHHITLAASSPGSAGYMGDLARMHAG